MTRRIVIRQFNDAGNEFLGWAAISYGKHPNSYKGGAVTAGQFFWQCIKWRSKRRLWRDRSWW